MTQHQKIKRLLPQELLTMHQEQLQCLRLLVYLLGCFMHHLMIYEFSTKPKYTMEFVLFDGEELCFNGSKS